MLQLAASLLVIIVAFAAVSVLAAIGAALMRNWVIFRKCALAAALAALGLIPTVGLFVFVARTLDGDADSASKATLLARGISDGMNIVAIALAILLVGIPCWLLAKRRAR